MVFIPTVPPNEIPKKQVVCQQRKINFLESLNCFDWPGTSPIKISLVTGEQGTPSPSASASISPSVSPSPSPAPDEV